MSDAAVIRHMRGMFKRDKEYSSDRLLVLLKDAPCEVILRCCPFILRSVCSMLQWNYAKNEEERELLSLIHCIKTVAEKSASINDHNVAEGVLISLAIIIEKPKLSDEVKLAVVTAMMVVLQHLSATVVEYVTSIEYMPLIGHLISVTLSLCSPSVMHNRLRVTAFDFLVELSELKSRMMHVIMPAFFPGIVIGCVKTIVHKERQSSKCIQRSLFCLRKYILLILSDSAMQEKHVKIETRDVKHNLFIPRTETWLTEVKNRFISVFSSLNSLAGHDSHKVRLECVLLTEDVVRNCQIALSGNLDNLVDLTSLLACDSHNDICEKALTLLNNFSSDDIEQFKARCLNMTHSLSRKTRGSLLNGEWEMLNAYAILEKQVSEVILRRLVLESVHCLALETASAGIGIPSVEWNDQSRPDPQSVLCWLQFVHLDKELFSRIKLVFSTLAITSFKSLFSILTDIFFTNCELVSPVLILMCITTEALSQVQSEEYISSVLHHIIFDGFFQQSYWLNNTSELNTIAERQRAIIVLSLFYDCLSTFSHCIKQDLIISSILYPAMVKLSVEGCRVQQRGLYWIWSLAKILGYTELSIFVQDNADHILAPALIDLHQISIAPSGAGRVVVLAAKCAGKSMLPLVSDVINLVLRLIDNETCSKTKLELMEFIADIAYVLKSWYSVENTNNSKPVRAKSDVVSEFRKFHLRMKRAAVEDNLIKTNVSLSDFESSAVEKEVQNDETDIDQDDPLYIKVASDVVAKCINMGSNQDVWIRSLALTAASHAFSVLNLKQNALLPRVHNIWNVLQYRLIDSNPAVARSAWRLLHNLGCMSHDFIRRRLVDGILPKTLSWLEESAVSSRRHTDCIKSQSGTWQNTQTDSTLQRCKCQETILQTLAPLCIASEIVPIHLKITCRVVGVAGMFLHQSMPSELQTAASNLITEINPYSPDVVWWSLKTLSTKDERHAKDFISNAYKLLEKLN